MPVNDRDELLAWADDWLENTPLVVHAGTVQMVERLAAALRARPQPDEPRCGDCGGPIDTNGLCLNLDIARPTGDNDD